VKFFKNQIEVSAGDARTAIAYPHLDRIRAETGGDRYQCSWWRVADGVFKQVHQDLFEQAGIGVQQRQIGRQVDHDSIAFKWNRELRQYASENLVDCNPILRKGNRADLETRHLKKFCNPPRELLGLIDNALSQLHSVI